MMNALIMVNTLSLTLATIGKSLIIEIILAVKFFFKDIGENMEHYLIVCETHLKTLLVGAEKIMCKSPENTQTVFVEYIDQAFCLDCVRII